jgi:hypothetical protein
MKKYLGFLLHELHDKWNKWDRFSQRHPELSKQLDAASWGTLTGVLIYPAMKPYDVLALLFGEFIYLYRLHEINKRRQERLERERQEKLRRAEEEMERLAQRYPELYTLKEMIKSATT